MSTVINEDETFQDNFNEMIETGSLVSFNQDQMMITKVFLIQKIVLMMKQKNAELLGKK